MSLKPRYFERKNGAVVEAPLPPFGDHDVNEADRGASLDDVDYSIREHLQAFELAVASARFADIPAAIAHLEGAATAAIKKSDFLISRIERDRNKAASAAGAAVEPVNVAGLLEVLRGLRNICPICGGVRANDVV